MQTVNNYPAGAADDPRAPYNEPLSKTHKVEVGVELGTIVEVDTTDEELSENEKRSLVVEKIIEKLHIDNTDVILNDIQIYNWE